MLPLILERPASVFGEVDRICLFSWAMAPVSAFTWLTTAVFCWFNADCCELRLAAALDTSPARVDADESTCSRSELSVGLASRDEKELKRLVMSLPMSPAFELLEPESGVKRACNVFNADNRAPEAEASCCC